MKLNETLIREHIAHFHSSPNDLCSVDVPYRVCPLGAHVDHQLGLVTGLALDRGVTLAFTPNDTGQVRLRSLDFEGEVAFQLDDISPAIPGDWGNYARGAALALKRSYDLERGIDGVIAGSLPIGGLGSSAAVGVAYLMALEHANDLKVDVAENIQLDQLIENQYLGLNNGVLDQSVILLSKQGCLLFLDCENGEHEHIPLPDDAQSYEVAIVYSGLTRSLVNTQYNQRVVECQQAAATLLELAGGLPASNEAVLRQVPEEVYLTYADDLPAHLKRRADHFFGECGRVRRGVKAWRDGDLLEFGKLMTQSGESSIHNYECGSPHLVTLYHLLNESPGVYGARFSGAGFQGCCIGLIDPSHREDLSFYIGERYPAAHPEVADRYSIHFCGSGNGARLL